MFYKNKCLSVCFTKINVYLSVYIKRLIHFILYRGIYNYLDIFVFPISDEITKMDVINQGLYFFFYKKKRFLKLSTQIHLQWETSAM